MNSCIFCSEPADVGCLCRQHAGEIDQCRSLTSEQIGQVEVEEPAAWLVDQWGCPHPLAATTTVGRAPAVSGMSILHPSISAEHAKVACLRGGAWKLSDLKSLNGTFHNEKRIQRAMLTDGDRIGFGQVQFFFTLVAVPDISGQAGRGRTQRVGKDALEVAVTLSADDGQEIRLVHRIEGGIGRVGGEVIEFAKLEFGLLRCLIERSRQFDDAELCFVSWQELSKELNFKSRAADSENVRELVRRVRRKLKSVNLPDLIESRQGVGYRLAANVKSFG